MMDLKDFFPSITFPRVYAQFIALGYHSTLSVLLAKLCCLDDRLPQGAPTSPSLSNLVAGRLDRRIVGYTHTRKIRYTRYADDLAFSNVENAGKLIAFIEMCVESEGFSLKREKTRVLKKHNRQMVTGIVVNNGMSPPRDQVRKMRQTMYYIKKYGLEAHQRFVGDQKPWLLSRLKGKITSMQMMGLSGHLAEEWLALIKKIRP